MRSLKQQIARIRSAKARTLLDDIAAQERVAQALERYLDGSRNDRQVRFDLENIIREAYRSSARAAQDTMRWQAGKGKKWAPVSPRILSPALRELLADVRRNLQEFKDSERDDYATRKAILRFRLSATTAAQRGFSDGQHLAAADLLAEGVEMRKFWSANFEGRQPCEECTALHGMEVGVTEEFPRFGEPTRYAERQGPPAHPQCRCDAIYLVIDDSNRDQKVVLAAPSHPKMIDSESIKKMPLSIFRAIVDALARALDLLRKAARL